MMSARGRAASLGVVVPVYNEQESLSDFHERLASVLDDLPQQTAVYYIDDGSTDGTPDLLERIARSDPRVTVIELSRNFGHQSALSAGLAQAREQVVITVDGDGQNPPELIPDLLKLYEAGYDIVLTQRASKVGATSFKRLTSSVFYWLINRLGNTSVPEGAADFRLHSRPVVQALNEMGEYHRFLRGMVSWMGFRSVILPYTPSPRIGGSSKYSLSKMVKLALEAIFSFSLVPLRIGILVGIIFLLLALLEMAYVVSFWIRGRQDLLVPGWSSLMFVILFVGGFLMVTLGFIGIYVGYVFQEVKRRPIYITRRVYGSGAEESAPPEASQAQAMPRRAE